VPDMVSIIDGSTNAVLQTTSLGSVSLDVNETTARVYAGYNPLSVLDASSLAVVNTVPLTGFGGTSRDSIAVNPVSNRIYVADFSANRLEVIAGATNARVATISLDRPHSVTALPNAQRAYVTNLGQDTVSVIQDGAPPKPRRCRGKQATIVGTNSADVIFGTNKRDVIDARAGNDQVFARRGRDIVCGGRGADLIHGGKGRDSIRGHGGADSLHGGKGRDSIDGQGGSDVIGGSTGADTLQGNRGDDAIRGGAGRDYLDGGVGGCCATGPNSGHDRLFGESGNDVLWAADFGSVIADGGAGADVLHGLRGDDTLRTVDGIGGNDSADGGGGVNTCTFDTGDVVQNC
jgi:Ca2+-binding RTX toxin-like protein